MARSWELVPFKKAKTWLRRIAGPIVERDGALFIARSRSTA